VLALFLFRPRCRRCPRRCPRRSPRFVSALVCVPLSAHPETVIQPRVSSKVLALFCCFPIEGRTEPLLPHSHKSMCERNKTRVHCIQHNRHIDDNNNNDNNSSIKQHKQHLCGSHGGFRWSLGSYGYCSSDESVVILNCQDKRSVFLCLPSLGPTPQLRRNASLAKL
jgi:hypothetical protein